MEVDSKSCSDIVDGIPISRDEKGVRKGFSEDITPSPLQVSSSFVIVSVSIIAIIITTIRGHVLRTYFLSGTVQSIEYALSPTILINSS